MEKKILLIGGTGLVGSAIADKLVQSYQVVITSKHHRVDSDYQLDLQDIAGLKRILKKEDPDIIISSVIGDYKLQLRFHEVLADWISGTSKRLLFISTANVFDGDLSRERTEREEPTPETDYGKFKRDCEKLLEEKISKQLIIFRLSGVWAPDCRRIKKLKEYSAARKPLPTFRNLKVNITLADQVGDYAKYVLDHDLMGIFHVGTVDLVDYFNFQEMVCSDLKIKQPIFQIDTVKETAFQAVVPGRQEIPQELQKTISDVLEALK